MTLVVVNNGEVLVDSLQTFGTAEHTVNKIQVLLGVKFTCAGSPDTALTLMKACEKAGEIDFSIRPRGTGDGTVVIAKAQSRIRVLEDYSTEELAWRDVADSGSVDEMASYVAGSGAEQFLGFALSGDSVTRAFEKVAQVNAFVGLPIVRF